MKLIQLLIAVSAIFSLASCASTKKADSCCSADKGGSCCDDKGAGAKKK